MGQVNIKKEKGHILTHIENKQLIGKNVDIIDVDLLTKKVNGRDIVLQIVKRNEQ